MQRSVGLPRFLRAFPRSILLGLGLGAAQLPACANGLEGTSVDLSEVSGSEDGGSGCSVCPPNHLCSAGACVPVKPDVDGDGDGYEARVDCNDADSAIHPGASETCNGKDDDCNGKIDDGFDKDNDGFFTCVHGTIPVDCNDDDANVKPGAAEVCNGKDDDCDGKIDEIPASLTGSLVTPLDTHWRVAGSAVFEATLGWVRLTSDAEGQSGALWWTSSFTFDTFDVTATIWIQSKSEGADGITFAWVPGAGVPGVGGGGNSVGVVGLGGFAVGVDTTPNTGEPAAPFLAVYDAATGAHLHRAGLPDIRNGLNHTMRVKLDAGQVSAWIDGTSYITAFAIPGYAPFAGHWGFTAATGGWSATHRVMNVTMSFPSGQGCVP